MNNMSNMSNNTTTAAMKRRREEEEYDGADSDEGERAAAVSDVTPPGSDVAEDTQTSSGSERPTKKPKAARKNKRSSSANGAKRPGRPLSAYNLFFRDERQRLMDAGESVEAVYGREVAPMLSEHAARPRDKFQFLVKVVSRRWNALGQEDRKPYEAMAKVEMECYQQKLLEFRDLEIQNAIQRPATPTQPAQQPQQATGPLADLQRLLAQQQQQAGPAALLQALQQQQSSNQSIASTANTADNSNNGNPGLAQLQQQASGNNNGNVILAMLLAQQQSNPNNVASPVSMFQQQPNILQQTIEQAQAQQQGQQQQQPLQGSSQQKPFNSWGSQSQQQSQTSQASVAWANIQQQLLKAPMENLLQVFSFFEVINTMERRISNLSPNSTPTPQDPQQALLAMLIRQQQGGNNAGLDGSSERQQEEARLQTTLQSHANHSTNPLISAMAQQLLDMSNHTSQDNRNMMQESVQTTLALQGNATPADFKNSSNRDLSLKIAQNHLMNSAPARAAVASSNHATSPPSQTSSLGDSGSDTSSNNNNNNLMMPLLQMILQQQQQQALQQQHHQPSNPSQAQ